MNSVRDLIFGHGSLTRAELKDLKTKCKDADNPSACADLGILFMDADGVKKDMSRAAGLFDKACAGGEGRACTNLGLLYKRGDGIQADDERATAYLKRACHLRHAHGCFILGMMHQRGDGVEANPDVAGSCFFNACSMEHEPSGIACHKLADMMLTRAGKGDDVGAARFYRRSCNLGAQSACTRYEELLHTTKSNCASGASAACTAYKQMVAEAGGTTPQAE
jgi:TPR repeat protein